MPALEQEAPAQCSMWKRSVSSKNDGSLPVQHLNTNPLAKPVVAGAAISPGGEAFSRLGVCPGFSGDRVIFWDFLGSEKPLGFPVMSTKLRTCLGGQSWEHHRSPRLAGGRVVGSCPWAKGVGAKPRMLPNTGLAREKKSPPRRFSVVYMMVQPTGQQLVHMRG